MHQILIVPDDLLEDDQVSVLQRASFGLLKAPNARDALNIATVRKPALIIYSNELRGMNALEFCQALRSDPCLRNTKLLMLTESLGRLDEEQHANIDGHLVCPVEPGQLSQTIGTLLDVPLRNAQRIQVELLAHVDHLTEGDGPQQTAMVNIINLSESGLLLESETHLRAGSVGKVSFYLPGEPQRLSLSCAVRGLLDEMMLHYGVEFLDLTDNEVESLQRFVHKRLVGKLAKDEGSGVSR